MGLHQWFQRGSGEVDTVVERSSGTPRVDRGENGPPYTDGPSPRTDLIGSPSGPDALSLRSEWRAGHDTSVMSGSRKVEEPQGGSTREARVFPQISNVQAADDHIAGAAHRNIEELTGNGPRQISQLGGPGGLLADSQMEWSQTKPRDRFHSPGNLHREPLESDCAGPQGNHRDIANSVQVYPKADGGSENGMGDLPDLRVSSPRRLSNLECSDIVDRASSIPHDRVQIEARQAAVRCTGGQPMGMKAGANIGLRKLLKLSLHNDTNLCYLNSTAIAASWTILQAQLHDQGYLHLAPALKLLCNRAESALNRPLKLLSQLPWNVLLQGWRDIHRQHDAPELVTHLLPRLRVNRSDDRWEARVSTEQGLHIQDQGGMHSPLLMFPHPGDTLYLQRVIDQWHLQAAVHALVNPPNILCIQLQRFTGEGGHLTRHVRPLQDCHHIVHVPIFESHDSTVVKPARYEVTAVQLHFGQSPDTGHYRTILRGQKKFGNLQTWITDDNNPAQSATENFPEASYLLWMRQVNEE